LFNDTAADVDIHLYSITRHEKKYTVMTKTAESVKTKWGIDPTHSEVQFKVKHLVISTVTGSFKKFQGEIITESEDFDNAAVNFTIDASSVDTNQADRDGHLKSEDFFAVAQHPELTFSGTLYKKKGNDYKLAGDLTIRGNARPVELDVEFGGIVKDPWGNVKAGFEMTGKINRKEYGLTWNALTEAGGVVVGEDVKLHINVEVVKG
jgi:polyisoprenoid-binding protein YceI